MFPYEVSDEDKLMGGYVLLGYIAGVEMTKMKLSFAHSIIAVKG